MVTSKSVDPTNCLIKSKVVSVTTQKKRNKTQEIKLRW